MLVKRGSLWLNISSVMKLYFIFNPVWTSKPFAEESFFIFSESSGASSNIISGTKSEKFWYKCRLKSPCILTRVFQSILNILNPEKYLSSYGCVLSLVSYEMGNAVFERRILSSHSCRREKKGTRNKLRSLRYVELLRVRCDVKHHRLCYAAVP